MKTSSHIDYLTVSYVSVKTPDEIFPPGCNLFAPTDEIKPFPFYDKAWRLACGGVLNTSEDEKQGSRLDLSGDPLWKCRDSGLSDSSVLVIACDTPLKKRTTRIDYCWNVFDAGSVRHTVNHYFAKRCTTTFRKPPEGYVKHGSRSGQTVYFGGDKSTQRVVVYDKGSELKLLNQALLRVEMRTRSPHSGAFYGDAIGSNLKLAARTRLLSLLDFPKLAWWQRAIYGDTIELGTVPRKVPKWQYWMATQVMNSIKLHWEADGNNDREFIESWIKKLQNELL